MTHAAPEAPPKTASPELPVGGTGRGLSMGRTALVLALTALVLSTFCAAFVGVVLIKAQQFSDGTWAGMPRTFQVKASVLLAAQAACGLMGLAAMALGATAFLRRRGRGAARMAMIVAGLGPLVAWGTWSAASSVAA